MNHVDEVFEQAEKIVMDFFSDEFFNNATRDCGFFKLFTEKRMQLLRTLHDQRIKSIRDLAEKLERDIKNVWEDLSILSEHNLIEFESKGRSKIPKLRRKVIIFRF